ncbi:MAG: 16S rRNA (cytosine(1402)-N(4))-methyltransferase RsmH [Clostridia bacterium]|jgi:16S rRNA (cytosine1402-N4)-methyltransferase|nr:16S rRNA (cytosine(1402)-N(4))-methyltransferase RsmH [Clostridia bacterium]MDD4275610.1 16S rRNA (cytosine(1402)-N(4))-methyltransferase RsmH [Clostridia bacterium]
MEFAHIPIMLNECVIGLNIKPNGIYVDGTLGGAGHSIEIIKHIDSGLLIGIDKDLDAIKFAQNRLKSYGEKVKYVHDDFKNIIEILNNFKIDKIDGILVDLGVSSYQIDNAERGFSYMHDGPLDMRMNTESGITAYDVVNDYSESELAKILFEYGEEKFGNCIARSIVREREKSPILSTLKLVEVIEKALPPKVRYSGGHSAKRTFQAIRIEVNGELYFLRQALKNIISMLNIGGRLCVITFHTLEDRIAKEVFNEYATDCICDKHAPVCICGHKATIKHISRKPISPSQEELNINSRAGSAKLRIIEKI